MKLNIERKKTLHEQQDMIETKINDKAKGKMNKAKGKFHGNLCYILSHFRQLILLTFNHLLTWTLCMLHLPAHRPGLPDHRVAALEFPKMCMWRRCKSW